MVKYCNADTCPKKKRRYRYVYVVQQGVSSKKKVALPGNHISSVSPSKMDTSAANKFDYWASYIPAYNTAKDLYGAYKERSWSRLAKNLANQGLVTFSTLYGTPGLGTLVRRGISKAGRAIGAKIWDKGLQNLGPRATAAIRNSMTPDPTRLRWNQPGFVPKSKSIYGQAPLQSDFYKMLGPKDYIHPRNKGYHSSDFLPTLQKKPPGNHMPSYLTHHQVGKSKIVTTPYRQDIYRVGKKQPIPAVGKSMYSSDWARYRKIPKKDPETVGKRQIIGSTPVKKSTRKPNLAIKKPRIPKLGINYDL